MASPLPDSLVTAELSQKLQGHADTADGQSDWPLESWQALRAADVLRWSIPVEFGGRGLTGAELLAGYSQLASACLTTAFILSQREAAVRRLIAAPPSSLRQRFLAALARGEVYCTVGLSQLTTSRQHGSPSLTATPTPAGGFQLDGVVPWVTGADQADAVVVGAPLPDGKQVLVMLPAKQAGLSIEPPLPLMALSGSRTARLRCDNVHLERNWLLAGPVEKVIGGKAGGVGGLETSSLALGLAVAATAYLLEEASRRPDLRDAADRLAAERHDLHTRLVELASSTGDVDAFTQFRVQCTRLVLQATQVALTAAKGEGFVTGHPVQRWARQALFFLVWSCPRPAAEGIVAHLLPSEPRP